MIPASDIAALKAAAERIGWQDFQCVAYDGVDRPRCKILVRSPVGGLWGAAPYQWDDKSVAKFIDLMERTWPRVCAGDDLERIAFPELQ